MQKDEHVIFNVSKKVLDNSSKETEKLQKVLKSAQHILFKLSSVFPFDLFSDQITIDEEKVSIIQNEFFSSEVIQSLDIKGIQEVSLETNPFFATLKLVPDTSVRKEIVVKYLKRNDALKARRIIEGLIIVKKEGVDLSKLNVEDLVSKLEALGKTSEKNL